MAVTAESIGLRERKAAATRLAIVASLRERLASTPLASISADDLAADAGVSRMTFFNYFPTKEHAVDLLMAIWLLELSTRIAAKRLRGVAAIELVFAQMGDEMAKAPERMRRLHAYFTSRPSDRPFPELGPAERAALGAPEESGPRGMGGLLMRLVDEARADGELDLEGSSYEIAHYLGSLATGAALVGHSSPKTDWARLFRRHVRRALGLLGSGKDPPPPRVPAEWKR